MQRNLIPVAAIGLVVAFALIGAAQLPETGVSPVDNAGHAADEAAGTAEDVTENSGAGVDETVESVRDSTGSLGEGSDDLQPNGTCEVTVNPGPTVPAPDTDGGLVCTVVKTAISTTLRTWKLVVKTVLDLWIGGVEAILTAWQGGVETVLQSWEGFVDATLAAWANLVGAVMHVWAVFVDATLALWLQMSQTALGAWNALADTTLGLTGNLLGWTGTTADQARSTTNPAANSVYDALEDDPQEMSAEGMGRTLKDIVDSPLPGAPQSRTMSTGDDLPVVPLETPMPRHIDNCSSDSEFAVTIALKDRDNPTACKLYEPPGFQAADEYYRIQLCDGGEDCGSMIVRVHEPEDGQAQLTVRSYEEGAVPYAVRVEVGNSALEYHFYNNGEKERHPWTVDATLYGVSADPLNLFGDPGSVPDEWDVKWEASSDRDSTRFYIIPDTRDQSSDWFVVETGHLYAVDTGYADRSGVNPRTFRMSVEIDLGGSTSSATLDIPSQAQADVNSDLKAPVAAHRILDGGPIVANPVEADTRLDLTYETREEDELRLTASLETTTPVDEVAFTIEYGHPVKRSTVTMERLPTTDVTIKRGFGCSETWCASGRVNGEGASIDVDDPNIGLAWIPEAEFDVAFGSGSVHGEVVGLDGSLSRGLDLYIYRDLGVNYLYVGGLKSVDYEEAGQVEDMTLDVQFTWDSTRFGIPLFTTYASVGHPNIQNVYVGFWNVQEIQKPDGETSVTANFKTPRGSMRLDVGLWVGTNDSGMLTRVEGSASQVGHLTVGRGQNEDGNGLVRVTETSLGEGGHVRFEAHVLSTQAPCTSSDTTLTLQVKRDGGPDPYNVYGRIHTPGWSACKYDDETNRSPGETAVFRMWTHEGWLRLAYFHVI